MLGLMPMTGYLFFLLFLIEIVSKNKYFSLDCFLLEFVENLVFGRILDETKQTSHYFHTFQVFTFNELFIVER